MFMEEILSTEMSWAGKMVEKLIREEVGYGLAGCVMVLSKYINFMLLWIILKYLSSKLKR